MLGFLRKKLIKAQLSKLPKDQQELIMALMEKHPEFFEKIAKEVKEKKKGGMDDQTAMMQVMAYHQQELQQMVMGLKK